MVQTEPIMIFNKNLNNLENTIYTACVLGAIEYFYIEISSIISGYCISKIFNQNHYLTHEIFRFTTFYMDFFEGASKERDSMMNG